jgi:hypothetical protein
MPEVYQEYRPRRTQTANKSKKFFTFPKKLGIQTAVSLVLLISVCTFKFSFQDSIVTTYIKKAVLYQPDTSELTNFLGNILNLYTEEGINNEKNNTSNNL